MAGGATIFGFGRRAPARRAEPRQTVPKSLMRWVYPTNGLAVSWRARLIADQ
jgi:hypothetical protein